MADLKTNYVDDVLDTTKNQLRKYQQIQNDDGTVSFVDVTEYTQVGTSFGAKDMNDTNAAINDVNRKLGESINVQVLTKTITTGSVSTAFGGYNGYADISSDIKDIKDKIISIIPVSYGEQGAPNLGGFCFMQSDTIVRLCSNRSVTNIVKITIIYK